jgi:PII-like signaling protein
MSEAPAGASPAAGQWKPAARLTVVLDEDDKWRHGPLYHEIVRRAREAGLAGASVWRGVEGYGASSRIHTSRILDLAEHLPVLVMVIDEAARLRRFVEQNSEVLAPVNVALSEVEIWQPGPGTGR